MSDGKDKPRAHGDTEKTVIRSLALGAVSGGQRSGAVVDVYNWTSFWGQSLFARYSVKLSNVPLFRSKLAKGVYFNIYCYSSSWPEQLPNVHV